MQQSYTPNDATLAKYAELIVKFGMQTKSGVALKKGSVVQFRVPEVAKPLYYHLQIAILKAGHHPMGQLIPSSEGNYNFEESFFTNAKKSQLEFYAEKSTKGIVDQIDGTIYILAETNPHALKNINSKKVLARSYAQRKGTVYRRKKIEAGNLAWTIALYGTDAMAKEAGMSLKDYWKQIENACYLKKTNPVAEWKRIDKTVRGTADKLTKLAIESVHMKGEDVDITIGIGSNRKWLAGGGCNIPSFEVFTTPHSEKVDGWIKLNQPHYRYGKKIEGIELWFKNGLVVKSSATNNHDLLKSMLKTPGGNRLGEFSLTDSRLSKIRKFMAEILYDENIGGKYGNTHVALGSAYRECYNGEVSKNWKAKDWEKLGFNNSVVHSDVISTTDRTVTATLANGKTKVIYKDGMFTI